ncbi:Disease resistance protein [Corchorus capsularis]|uniref:Disease resistance protein n=1 Tax=Corchorus capsularis TaxID=210143 RepID=A0A1R3FYD0_COCAP|nr:Disease resistance protein [Corchorus capsularis]
MDSLIVSPLLQVIYEKLASYVIRIGTLQGRKKDIKKLRDTLLIIQAVIEDAEERQLKDNKVKIWLSKLRDVAYDADDLLDEISTQFLQRELVKQKPPTDQSHKISIVGTCRAQKTSVRNKLRRIQSVIYKETQRRIQVSSFTLQSVPGYFKISHKLKEICQRMDDIAKEMSTFQFKEVNSYDTREKRVRETGPTVDESKVYGRREEVKQVLDLLVSNSNVWVIPIVGIGGIGKTTLAQLVYNDQRLDGHFDLKIWVSLYDNFSTKKIVSKILECVTKHRCASSEMIVLQSQLQESVCGKRYLIVLDDTQTNISVKKLMAMTMANRCLKG